MDSMCANALCRDLLAVLPPQFRESRLYLDSPPVPGPGPAPVKLVIERTGSVHPLALPLRSWLIRLENGEDREKILFELAEWICRQDSGLQPDSYAEAQPYLTTRLCETEAAARFLTPLVKQEIGAFSLYVCLEREQDARQRTVRPVTLQEAAGWKMSPHALLEATVRREMSSNPPQLLKMRRDGRMEKEKNYLQNGAVGTQPAVFALTTQKRRAGAAAAAWEGVLAKAAAAVHASFYVIPSSTDEMLIAPHPGPRSGKKWQEILLEANRVLKDMAPEKVLSGKVHFYDRHAGHLTPLPV